MANTIGNSSFRQHCGAANSILREPVPPPSLPGISTTTPYDGNHTSSRELQQAVHWEQQLQDSIKQVPAQKALLQLLIRFLVATLRPAGIYLTQHEGSIAGQQFTVSVALPGKGPVPEGLRPVLDIAYLQHRNAHCSLHNEANVIAALNNHEFYALLQFARANRVYDDSRLCYPAPTPEQRVLAQQKARAIFTTHFEKASGFLQLAHTNTAIPELTLFLLHQSIELTCRAVLLSLGGLNIKEHGLQVLFKHLRRLAPQLPADKKDQPVLELLEKSYIGARYEAGFAPNTAYIPFLLAKAALFQNTAAAAVARATNVTC